MGEEENQREESMRFHVPMRIVVAFIAIILLDLFCMIRFPSVVKEYKIYKKAEQRMEQGYTSAALRDLYEVAENHTNSIPILVKLVRLSMRSGNYDMAGYIFDTYLVGKDLEENVYNEMDSYYNQLNAYYTTYDAVSAIYETYDTSTSGDTNDRAIINLNADLQNLLKEDGMNQAFVHYYLANSSINLEDALNEYLACYQLDSECNDVRVQLAIIYRRMGELDKARQYAEEALKIDVEDSGAWRAMATIALVDGNLTDGLEDAKKAYELEPDGIYIRDTYLVALHVNNQAEQEKVIKDEMLKADERLDADMESLLKGETTLTEYYIGD
ncbi:MAG: hypothetical protein PWP24_81 [Clostridiales bacterium]|nr:hypothetical protein [Clostridiales bacterium]